MVSYVHSYQVRNTLLRINYLTCLVSTMAPSSFGPYHGMWLEDAQTKCIGVIPTPWDDSCTWFGVISSTASAVGSVIESKKMLPVGSAHQETFGGYID
jgi:hypothetical protein